MSAGAWGVAERTPAKPGPGPLPDELLRALDLTVVRRVEGLLAGDHRAHVLGRGTELAQVRPYVPGEDDVRDIDWNVTARTGEPHVRVQLAERVLVSWILLDTSPSMHFGTADRRKADVAEGVAIAVGHVATASVAPTATSALRRSAVPNAIDGERSSAIHVTSTRSASCTRTCGSPVRAVTFQSIRRTSSPGTYGRTCASSLPRPSSRER